MFHKEKAILSISEISSSDVTVRMRIYSVSNAISGYQNTLPCLVFVSDGIGLGSIVQLSGKGSKVCLNMLINGPRRGKTCLKGFRQSETQTSLLSYRD